MLTPMELAISDIMLMVIAFSWGWYFGRKAPEQALETSYSAMKKLLEWLKASHPETWKDLESELDKPRDEL